MYLSVRLHGLWLTFYLEGKGASLSWKRQLKAIEPWWLFLGSGRWTTPAFFSKIASGERRMGRPMITLPTYTEGGWGMLHSVCFFSRPGQEACIWLLLTSSSRRTYMHLELEPVEVFDNTPVM